MEEVGEVGRSQLVNRGCQNLINVSGRSLSLLCTPEWEGRLAGMEGVLWELWESGISSSDHGGGSGDGVKKMCLEAEPTGPAPVKAEERGIYGDWRFWLEGVGGWWWLLVRWGRIGVKQILKGQNNPRWDALSHHQNEKNQKGDGDGDDSNDNRFGKLALIARIEPSQIPWTFHCPPPSKSLCCEHSRGWSRAYKQEWLLFTHFPGQNQNWVRPWPAAPGLSAGAKFAAEHLQFPSLPRGAATTARRRSILPHPAGAQRPRSHRHHWGAQTWLGTTNAVDCRSSSQRRDSRLSSERFLPPFPKTLLLIYADRHFLRNQLYPFLIL